MGQELEKFAQEEKDAAALVQADFGGDDDLQIPILKVAQQGTTEVHDGVARAGEFVNSLTSDVFPADGIEFIVTGFEKGRFRSNDDGEVICTGREGACGCHGTSYEECPDSEEQFRAAVKRGDIEWGSGPPCATTYNFTGYVLGSDMPVRISLKRGQAKAAKKWLTMLRFAKSPWDRVFELSTYLAEGKGDTKYQNVRVKQGRHTEAAERQTAVSLALALRSRQTRIVGDEADEPGDKPPADNPDAIDY